MAGFTCHSDLLISHLRYQEFAVGRTNNPGLVGGLDNFFIFPYIGNSITPTDFHIFQDG